MGLYFNSIKWKGIFAGSGLKDREFMQWVIAHPDIFEKFLFANQPNSNSFDFLYFLWSKEGKEFHPPLLNLALGAAVCLNILSQEECVARYNFYKNSFLAQKLFLQFSTLEPWEYILLLKDTESVAGGIETLAWGQAYLLEKKQHINEINAASKVCGLIPYRNINERGISIHSGLAFYDNKQTTLQIYTTYGGVCGAVSKAACGFLKSRGIPCYTIGQPGHCAFIWKRADGSWTIGNNIYGWAWSNGNPQLPWKGSTSIIKSISQFNGLEAKRSNLCMYLSEFLPNTNESIFFLEQAIEFYPSNYRAWKLWLSTQVKQASEIKKKDLAIKIRGNFKNDPFIVSDLIDSLVPFNWKNTSPYEIYALLLDENESPDSNSLYMKKIWDFVRVDIPELKLSYNEKNKNIFFKSWKTYYKDNNVSLKTKRQTCYVFQKILIGLTQNEKTYSNFIETYEEILNIWNNKELMRDADKFIRSQLNNNQPLSIRKKLIKFGMLLTETLEDMRGKKFYIEKNQKI